MIQYSVEIEPIFFLRAQFPDPLTARQMVTLRRVGPGLAERAPKALIDQLRQSEELMLGPYYWKSEAQTAQSSLSDVDVPSELIVLPG